MQVIPNSTFIFPLLEARSFGNDISRARGNPDRQRGDLVVALCPQGNPTCSPATNPAPDPCPTPRPDPPPPSGYYLGTRYVTSVMAHPASNAGLRGYLEVPNWGATWGLVGQDLAVLDVPANVCPGTYVLSVRTRAVNLGTGASSSPGTNETISTTVPSTTIVVRDVVPGGEVNSNIANPYGVFDLNIEPDLADLVPNPTVPLHLANMAATSSYPAAAEIDVTYPRSRVEILGAYQDKQLGIGALVAWRDHPGEDRVTISIVDPKRCTGDLRIVFKLRLPVPNPNDPLDPLTDFSTNQAAQRLYDFNGSLITGNWYVVGNPT